MSDLKINSGATLQLAIDIFPIIDNMEVTSIPLFHLV